MRSIVKYSCAELNAEIDCVLVNGEPWFKGVQVAKILGFESRQSRSQAFQTHVDDEDKQCYKDLTSKLHVNKNIDMDGSVSNGLVDKNGNLDGSVSKTIFVNESGLYALIFGSSKPEAKVFKRWVTSEVLPSIRKNGSYTAPLVGKQVKLLNEKDLHYKVVDCIRNRFPHMRIVAGLGELQDTVPKRSDAYKKGYIGGQPDLMVLNRTKDFDGFAIELKNPNGNWKLSDKQEDYLENLALIKFKTLVSDDYDEIVVELTKYYEQIKYPCPHCPKVFNSPKTIRGHLKTMHESHLKV